MCCRKAGGGEVIRLSFHLLGLSVHVPKCYYFYWEQHVHVQRDASLQGLFVKHVLGETKES